MSSVNEANKKGARQKAKSLEQGKTDQDKQKQNQNQKQKPEQTTPDINTLLGSTHDTDWLAQLFPADTLTPSTTSTGKGITTALHIAVEHDHINLVQLLLAHEPQQYNVQDAQGRTALHIAAQKGSSELITKLLFMEHEARYNSFEQGMQVRPLDLQDVHGRTALLISTELGQGGIVQEFLRLGANPDIGDWLGRRPLHVATMRGDKEVVRLLLEGRANTYLD